MKLFITKYSMLIVILILSISLISCSQIEPSSVETTTETQNVEKASIFFRITWNDYSGRGETIQKIVNAYNTENNGKFFIDLISGDEDLTNVTALMETKDNQTIFALPYRYVRYFGEDDALYDLTQDFQSDIHVFYPKLVELGSVDESIFGIPWVGHSICLLYNADLLEQAGVEPESITSLDSLTSALEAVEANTDAQGIGLVGAKHNDISWMVNQFIYGFGSNLVDESGKNVTINNANAKEAITFYKDTLGSHAQENWLDETGVEVMDHFRNGEVAFEFQGVWGLTDIEKNGDPFDVGLINLDTIGLVSEVGPIMLSIPDTMTDEMKAESVAFIRYMISVDAQQMIMTGEYSPEHDRYYPFRVPTRIDMDEALNAIQREKYLPFIEGFENPSVDVPVPKWQTIKEQYYESGLHQVMTNEITIDAFLAEVERLGNEILAQE